ncbi:MAG: hypothetical protein QOE77_1171 [Blastocatellia bacterium]|nr:hypothetical protein [Blastocatellia bacterium]
MAATNDWMQSALQHYREQRERIIEQLAPELLFEFRAAEVMIRKLEQDLGAAPQIVFSDPPYSGGAGQFPGSPSPSKSPVKPAELRADEFFAMTISEAARAYLSRVGHAVSLDEMLERLRAGGCKVGGANPKQTLYISLVRNTRDFVPTGSGFIGLRSFYPGLKAGAVKNADKQKKKGKQKGKAKSKAGKLLAKKGQPKPPKVAPGESLAHKTVYGTLNDGEFHSKDEILKAGEAVGIKPIAIRGILSNAKDLEVEGDSYRLKATY